MKILHIDSSILGENSVSRKITAEIISALQESGPHEVLYRDVTQPAPERPESKDAADELLEADLVLVGAPMYNLGIPHQLKSWVDSISVARKTFHYTEKGLEGLAGGRKVIIVYTSGGFHSGPTEDFVEPYLRAVFGLVGITEVEVLRLEGLNISEEHKAKALAAAHALVPDLAAKVAA